MTDRPDLTELLAASNQLARLGLSDVELTDAHRHARAAIALTLGHPDKLAARLDAHANDLAAQARERARAQYATQNVRLTLSTGRLTHAAHRLRDALRSTMERIDLNRQNPN